MILSWGIKFEKCFFHPKQDPWTVLAPLLKTNREPADISARHRAIRTVTWRIWYVETSRIWNYSLLPNDPRELAQ